MLIYIYMYLPLYGHLRLVVLCDGQRCAVTAAHPTDCIRALHRCMH